MARAGTCRALEVKEEVWIYFKENGRKEVMSSD